MTTITAGAAAYTDGSDNRVAEVPTTLTLTPIGASPAITAGSVGAGTQVGEFKTIAVTVALTAGTPNSPGTDGSYATSFTITGTGGCGTATIDVITTVSSPLVTIAKGSNRTNAVTGDVITYTITVTNTHATASVTGVNLIDPMPQYTTYVPNSTTLNINSGGAVAQPDIVGVSPLVAGLLLGTGNTGIMAASEVDVVTFQVTVD